MHIAHYVFHSVETCGVFVTHSLSSHFLPHIIMKVKSKCTKNATQHPLSQAASCTFESVLDTLHFISN